MSKKPTKAQIKNNMEKEIKKLAIFEGKKIRRHYDQKTETWFFSVVDIVQVLTESANPTDYMKKLRKRDLELANYIGTNCPQVEIETESWENRKTLAGNPEQLFRIIQSIPCWEIMAESVRQE
ncbi:MAG: hypothetical protein Q8P20_08150 [bacterium]|nr:hypothetical protein [bacterium]